MNCLPEYEQQLLDQILERYTEMFNYQPGKVKGYACKIRLKNDLLICVSPYPIPLAKQKAVENKVKRMVDLGIIERSNSPYSITIIPVFKENREVRLCLNSKENICTNNTGLRTTNGHRVNSGKIQIDKMY